MNIVLPGGTGQIGTLLARHFHSAGHAVAVLSRSPRPAPWRTAAWDAGELDGADVVINLAGRSVNCRYTPANRAAIMDSRIESTRALGRAIAAAARPPALWLQSSTATIYPHRFDAPNDESSGTAFVPGDPDTWRFSHEVAAAWERALDEAAPPGVRTVKLRSAMVMSPDAGGVFATLLGLVRAGLGGRAGSGRQYVSWIHAADFVRAIEWLIARDDLAGPINLAAPNPLPNAEFMRELRAAWGARFGLAAPARWMLEAGAWALRTETELILKSRRVVPARLLGAGFAFQFPLWPAAARDLAAQARGGRSGAARATAWGDGGRAKGRP
ncbi:MAG TPA: TIGR01777 family oxidoreductase [Herpetosiphonaceae bacterium]|nr:TIGR01777 family oxidoreductase [Herpetosiphonaceae bacterium]